MAIYLRGLMMGLAYVAPIGSLIVIWMGIGLIRSPALRAMRMRAYRC